MDSLSILDVGAFLYFPTKKVAREAVNSISSIPHFDNGYELMNFCC